MADDVVIVHPNRSKASSQLARLVVIALLLASAAVVLIVTIGGWDTLEGAKFVPVAYVAVYVVFALFVARWSRGALAMAAALAVILGIFAGVAAPAWFDRDKPGFTDPAIDADMLGLLCFILLAMQAALVIAALVGFRQRWNVEEERPVERDPEPARA
jgi:uncharacterized membrane protein